MRECALNIHQHSTNNPLTLAPPSTPQFARRATIMTEVHAMPEPAEKDGAGNYYTIHNTQYIIVKVVRMVFRW